MLLRGVVGAAPACCALQLLSSISFSAPPPSLIAPTRPQKVDFVKQKVQEWQDSVQFERKDER